MVTSSEALSVCNQFGFEYEPINSQHRVAINLESFEQMPIYGVRIKPVDNNTGWYIWGGEYFDDISFYAPVHADHLDQILPAVQKYLALAPGWKFIIDNTGYEDVWFDPKSFARAGQT